jgi:hypothetical protein
MADSGGSEKDAVADYFNTQGFERWNKIYGTTEDVNKVKCAAHSYDVSNGYGLAPRQEDENCNV